MNGAAVQQKAIELGKLVLRMTTRAGSGHPSSSLSLAHIVTYLMYHQMRWDPANPWDPAADRLVLSEGHAVPIVYAALADRGARVGRSPAEARPLTTNDLDQLRALESVLDGHPNPAEGVPFFDAATGSLGQGLSVAAGLALGARLDGTDRRVYCLVGDGESREGQIWEAADFIVDHRLTSVCAVFSSNGQGQAGNVSPQQSTASLVAKLRAFNWDVAEIDGHNPTEIGAVFAQFAAPGRQRPLAVVARTVKGWGVEPLLRGNWHGKPLDEKDLAAGLASLDNQAPPGKALDRTGEGVDTGPQGKAAATPVTRVPLREVQWPGFGAAMDAAGLRGMLDKGAVGTRRAYGAALKAAGAVVPQVVVLDGDVGNSTFSEMFANAFPERFFEGKIAEQNIVSTAAGLSAAGFIPFVNSFAKFIARAYDQVEMANISRANIKLVGSHSGISLGADGPSQMSLADVAYFRAFTTVRGDDRADPLGWLLHPADAVAAYQLTRLMVELPGMCYMRTHRPDVPLLYAPDAKFEPRGLNVLATGDDLALISAGYMVFAAREAARLLALQNIRATLVDAYCLPLDGARLLEVLIRAGRQALVVEDNYGGGLGAAVAEVAARSGRLRVQTLHVQRIPKSARTAEAELEYCGVSPAQIADHALALLKS